ncbi:MAG TPA: 16S rRNA (adenine(1518)-N(6)/adenine(1519)-N(6))-dimethyltransferase RsmA [Candidatus Babeliales bacterium]|nr:16S rRNA (adenine(1518)-N(6)/adenine(1519)-N(6))-dimethyltransferase RsmA [Candidatus Babeliales bacterium]
MSQPRIALKKKFGQHFLRDARIPEIITNTIDIAGAYVFEIGCGDGVLTHAILQKPIKQLWVFEIDPEWVAYVRNQIQDNRLTIYNEDILTVDFARFKPDAPWILLANLPYQITFPILHKLQEHRDILQEAIVMVQEEVAQKLVQTSGRGYGFSSLFFQHYFDIELLTKIPPTAFEPPPKVYSRLMYLRPRTDMPYIPDEDQFWQFIKACFRQPRRMLKHNLAQSNYNQVAIPQEVATLRAQQMSMQDLLTLWLKVQLK